MESQELKKLPFCIVFNKNNKIFKQNAQHLIFRHFLPKFGQKSIFHIFVLFLASKVPKRHGKNQKKLTRQFFENS